jgi:four helix bundle protein
MSRDHTKLRVFHQADTLVLDIYRATKELPLEERYGLQAQIRRAAVSAASNVVEGCARKTTKDYLHFCNIAAGSACEMRYLLSVADRLGFLPEGTFKALETRCTLLAKGFFRLIAELDPQR